MLNDRPTRIVLPLLALLLSFGAGPGALAAAEHERAGGDGGDPAAAARVSCVPAEIVSRSEWPEPIPSPWHRWRELMGLGKCHLAAGRPGLAAVYFRMGLREGADVEAAWRLNLLRAQIDSGDRWGAEGTIPQLLAQPEPGMRNAVRALVAETIGPETGTAPAAVQGFLAAYFRAVDPEPGDYPLAEELERLQRNAGPDPREPDAAAILWQIPKNEDSARRSAANLRTRSARGREPPGADAFSRRAKRLRRLRLHKLIREELAPGGLPPLPAESARAAGRIYFWAMEQGRAYSEALRALDDPEVRRAFSFGRSHGLTLAVGFHLKRKELGLAAAQLGELAALDPAAPSLATYYLELARRAKQAGDLAAMTRWCTHLTAQFADHRLAAEAYWMVLWENYRRGALNPASHWAEAFLATGLDGPQRARMLYWLGRIRKVQGDREAADAAWARLVEAHPRDFYGLLAQGESLDRLAEPAAPPPRNGAAAGVPMTRLLWEAEALRRPLVLFLMGEPELAEAALRKGFDEPAPEPALWELATALGHLGRYHLMQRVAARSLRAARREGRDPDRAALRMAYPLAFWEIVANGAGRKRLSPYFVMAVMREESHFRVDADSVAGAKGLMQLMPATAAMVAKENGVRLDEDALFRPAVNIRLGTLYLERLYRRFKGNAVHTAASYNAGPTAVRRWLRTMKSLPPGEFVERIPYGETQRYVKKVLATAALYRRLYSGQ